jgi:hypothetical protein
MADAGIGESILAGAALGDVGATGAALGAGEGLGGFGALNLGGSAASSMLSPAIAEMASGMGSYAAAPGMGSMANIFTPMGNAMMGGVPEAASTLIPSVAPNVAASIPSGIPMGVGDTGMAPGLEQSSLMQGQGNMNFDPTNPYANTPYDPSFMGRATPNMNVNPANPYANTVYDPNFRTQPSEFDTSGGTTYNNPDSPNVPLSLLDKAGNWTNRQVDNAGNWISNNPLKAAGLGLGAYTLYNMLSGKGNNYLTPYQPPSAASYGLGRTLASNYRPTRPFAEGGIASLSPNPNVMSSGAANINFMGGDMYPQSQMHRSYYATPTQAPMGAQQAMVGYEPATNPLTGELTANMAEGGITSLGSYSDGGQMLKGPGDGMSDNIPASIGDKQPARLADGEFVVPADVVSHLGNGSTDAGAKQLYAMLDKVRKARTGNPKQGKQINPQKFMPA